MIFQKMSKKIRILTDELTQIVEKAELDPKQYELISAETDFIR